MLHEKLKELRKLKGLSQEEVAKALHVQQNTYCGWKLVNTKLAQIKYPQSVSCSIFNLTNYSPIQ